MDADEALEAIALDMRDSGESLSDVLDRLEITSGEFEEILEEASGDFADYFSDL